MPRPPSTESFLRREKERVQSLSDSGIQVQAPIATEMFLPNLSGARNNININGNYLWLSGANANQTINIGNHNFITDGRIGIGTTNPLGQLSIYDATEATFAIDGGTGKGSFAVNQYNTSFNSNLGVQFNAETYITFATDATERIRILDDGKVGIWTSTPAEVLDVSGAAVYRDDFYFAGEGSGLPYGSCYGNDIVWTQASAAQNTWYNITDTDMADGELNLVTHDGSGKLTVTKAGRYLINYSICIASSAANTHIETGIEISGSGSANAAGQNHAELVVLNQDIPISSTAILDLAASATLEIAVRTTDASTPNLLIEHLNITCQMLGGT